MVGWLDYWTMVPTVVDIPAGHYKKVIGYNVMSSCCHSLWHHSPVINHYCLSVCLFVCLSLCLCVFLSVCLSVYLFACLSVWLKKKTLAGPGWIWTHNVRHFRRLLNGTLSVGLLLVCLRVGWNGLYYVGVHFIFASACLQSNQVLWQPSAAVPYTVAC